jgi:hypothetical protein
MMKEEMFINNEKGSVQLRIGINTGKQNDLMKCLDNGEQ